MTPAMLRLIVIAGLASACSSQGDGAATPSPSCCQASEQPGTNGNPICIEGASCCADGRWACNEGDGSPACSGGVCEKAVETCCDPALEPGTNGHPFCIEGASCCADGAWTCNEGDGSSTCGAGGVCR